MTRAGEFWATMLPEERVRIDRADKHILVAEKLRQKAEEAGWYGEGILLIEGCNATVRYRLDEFDAWDQAWRATRIGPGVPSKAGS